MAELFAFIALMPPVVFNGIALGAIAAIAVYHVMALVSKARGSAQV